jgi:hypothetical protein
MGTLECRRLRSALTAYVDREAANGETRLVEAHLRSCGSCQLRVRRAEAVRQRLRRWSADMAGDGAATPPRSISEAPFSGLPVLAARTAIVGTAGVTLALVLLLYGRWSAGAALAATGHITDSRCATGHTHTSAALRDIAGRECVRRCVEMGAEYVFLSNGVVYHIGNQDFRGLDPAAGQDVELVGELRGAVLTVSQVRVVEGSALARLVHVP